MRRDERGMALVLVLFCATLFLALVGALVSLGSTEATISATFRDGAAALMGAEAGIMRALADITSAPDLNAILRGSSRSGFSDGLAMSRLPDGRTLDLLAATNIERCGAPTCTDPQLDAVTAERPWGANNARWALYASGWLRDLTTQLVEPPRVYVVVWVGDDPLETDEDPLTDAPDVEALGHDVVLIRASAYAAYSVRRRIEVAIRRRAGRGEFLSWRELR